MDHTVWCTIHTKQDADGRRVIAYLPDTDNGWEIVEGEKGFVVEEFHNTYGPYKTFDEAFKFAMKLT